jgi:hypothetical protein
MVCGINYLFLFLKSKKGIHETQEQELGSLSKARTAVLQFD